MTSRLEDIRPQRFPSLVQLLIILSPHQEFSDSDSSIMKYSLATIALVAEAVTAFPFVSRQPGVDSSLLRVRQQSGGANPGGPLTCPYNPPEKHVPAAPVTAQFHTTTQRTERRGTRRAVIKFQHQAIPHINSSLQPQLMSVDHVQD